MNEPMTLGEWRALDDEERREIIARELRGWFDFRQHARRGLVARRAPGERHENVPRYESWVDQGDIYQALVEYTETKGYDEVQVDTSWHKDTGWAATVYFFNEECDILGDGDATANEIRPEWQHIPEFNEVVVLAAMRAIGVVAQ